MGHLVFYGAAMFCFSKYVDEANSIRSIISVSLGLFTLGFILEFLQYKLANGRVLDWFDQLANTVGILSCMSIFNFQSSNFYSPIVRDRSWNDLVFTNRNKNYGAYELRKLYSKTIAWAYLYSILVFVLILLSPYILKLINNNKKTPDSEVYEITDVHLSEPPAGNSGKEISTPQIKTISQTDKKATAKPSNEIINPKVTKDNKPLEDSKKKDDNNSNSDGETVKNSDTSQSGKEDGSTSSSGDSLSNNVFRRASQWPLFAGCNDENISYKEKKKCSDGKLLSFLKGNIKYPSQALKNKTTGTVLIQFIVEKNGSISNISIVKDIGDGCGSEARRVLELINSMKLFWHPGIQGNNAVRFQYTLPVEFEGTW
ncbi:MAG: energy transducer TonB [Saprospiraceae bacterium]|nr:energy transducer TonB [Saprospiraceae bacterium]